jgi:hypothetical protein
MGRFMSTESRRLLIAAIAEVQDAMAQLDEAGVHDLEEYRATLQAFGLGSALSARRSASRLSERSPAGYGRGTRQLVGAEWQGLRLGRPVPRQPPTGAMTATLFMNDDFSRCGACGRSADPSEAAHRNGRLVQPPGCGAQFVAVSSDMRLTPRLRRQLAARRPDLPLADDQIH